MTAHRRLCMYSLIALMVILTGVTLITRGILFGVREVRAPGITRYSSEQLMALAGLRYGDSVLLLNEEAIESGLNADRYLLYDHMEHTLSGVVTLYITQREPIANLVHKGDQYTLDKEGMVLEYRASTALDNGLINITGMVPRSVRLGMLISCQNTEQLGAYRALMEEIELQKCGSDIAEINVADVNGLYYITVDGFAVRLGDADNLRVKIGTARAVVIFQREQNAANSDTVTGIIDASIPEYTTFSPI